MSRQPDSFKFGSLGSIGGMVGSTHGTINPSFILGGGGSAATTNVSDSTVNQNSNPITPHQLQGPFSQVQLPAMHTMGPPFFQSTPQNPTSNQCVIQVGDVSLGVWWYDPMTMSWSHTECELCRTYRHHISDAEYDQVPSFIEARAQDCEAEIRHLRDELRAHGPPPNRVKRHHERGDSPPPQRIRTERGYRPSPARSSRAGSPRGSNPRPSAPPPVRLRRNNDAMEVDDVGPPPAPPTLRTTAGSHTFVPYESPLHHSTGGLFGSYQVTPPSDEESDYNDSSDNEHRDDDIRKALNKFPHSNRAGPQSLTSGWDYYQKYQPTSKSAFRALDRDRKDLPPPCGKLRRIEPHLPTSADEAERILALVKASPESFLAYRWKHIVSDIQERSRLVWVLTRRGMIYPLALQGSRMPVKAAPASDWFAWCLWNHRAVDCPGVFIMRDGPLVCSTVEAWRLSRDLSPAQVANPRLRTRFTEVFVMLVLRPGWYGQFLDHHSIPVAAEYDPYTRFPGNWIQNLDLAALSRFLAERGVTREVMDSYLLFGKTWATCMLSQRPNQSEYWQQQLTASHDWIKAIQFEEPSWYDAPSWSPPLEEGWDLTWIARYRKGRMDKWEQDQRDQALPNSGPSTGSTVPPESSLSTVAPPDSGVLPSESISHSQQALDIISSDGTVPIADDHNTQIDDGGDTIMVDPVVQLAASIPLPLGDDGL
ncbi:uncharacterized protein EV420DRAFT_1762161 [Desarmillaria tabescens]|uniref:Uncharacterized protein n=1 Tax=Armillaria tabescens TaxID=1929756 RepID=A0AA39T3L2_ARMTA|nr:uncharacterized protein EV420DRAFT_1762161 [Desarmillaria tabescens]KAK0462011.1 hypothetical protein EV420DRAFT_1762161 [Desarmillaria tabescens]